MAAPAAQPIRPPVTRAGALKAREELVVWLRRKEGRGGVAIGGVGFWCCLVRDPVLSFDLVEIAMVDVVSAVGTDGAMLDFLPCRAGRLAFGSFRVEGALVCRDNDGGTTGELLDDAGVSFGWIILVLELALSALRRAGFFRGFLLGVVLEGWGLTAFGAVSVGAAMSIYLHDSVFLTQESVGPVHKNELLRLCAM